MRSNLFSGILGGAVAVVVGLVLIATGAIDTGSQKTVVERQPPVAAQPASEHGSGLTVSDIYRKTGPGVAYIQAQVVEQSASPLGLPQKQRGQATGSGFVLDDKGDIATNAHVVAGASNVQVSFGQGNPVAAKVVGRDVSTDIAVIRVDPSKVKLNPVPLGESKSAHVGDPVVAIGNPLGYDDTVTTGIVSAVQRQIKAPNGFSIDNAIQTDAAINPGNSGGPLLDADGRVIGITSQIATSGGSKGNVGIGFAVPVDLAKQIIPQLIKSGQVQHAYIGVTTSPVTPQIAKRAGLPSAKGALVQQVAPGSPAAKAGLRAGKNQTPEGIVTGGVFIVGVDGKTVNNPTDIAGAISSDKPGQQVQLQIYRGSAKKTVTLTLADRPNKAPSGSGAPAP